MSPGFQYDAPIAVRLSDQNFLRAELAYQARQAEKFNKPSLARALRDNAKNLKGSALLDAALGARYSVRA